MNNTYLSGIGLLLVILAARWGTSYWRGRQFQGCWSKGWDAFKANDLVGAEAAFRVCVRLAPTASLAHRALGSVLVKRGKLEEAEERLRFGSDLEPRNASGHLDLGFYYALCVPDRVDDAIDSFAKAIEHKPELRAILAQEARLAALRQHAKFKSILESHK